MAKDADRYVDSLFFDPNERTLSAADSPPARAPPTSPTPTTPAPKPATPTTPTSSPFPTTPVGLSESQLLQKEEIARAQAALKDEGLDVVDVGGEGDCQFRAFMHAIGRDPDDHMQARAVAVIQLRGNPQKYKQFFKHESEAELDVKWDEWLQAIGTQGEYGDNYTLRALAIVFGLNVRVVSVRTTGGVTMVDINVYSQIAKL